jgi:predicted ATPase
MFNLGSAVKIKPIGRYSGFFQVIITNPKSKIDATINDVGFGVSQVLPLIVEGFYSGFQSTLLIEQPEIHLHPKVQSDMADLFIEFIKDGRKLIVETHSEHLISRLARRIAEGDGFRKEDLAIYYFTTGENGTVVDQIRVNDLGQFENWPQGFFEEDYTEALIHNKLVAEKLKNLGARG